MALPNASLNPVNKVLGCILYVFQATYGIISCPARTTRTFLFFFVDFILNKSKSTIQKCLFIWTVLVILVSISFLFYQIFYTAYVPTAEISRPVYLTFSVCSSGIGICSFPFANVTFWNAEHTFQEVLGPGQAYSVSLELEMPDSQANRELGMFLVVIKMYDRDGNITATSQRSVSMSVPALYKYRSIVMRMIDTVVLSPLYFLGFLEQKGVMTVELFTHFVDDYYNPSLGAIIEIHSYRIEIYSAKLKLLAKFTGLKYFLYYWPIMSALSAFWINLVLLGISLAVVLYQRNESLKKLNKDAQNKENDPDRNEVDFSETTVAHIAGTDEKDLREQSTQTKSLDDDDDDPNLYVLPLIQEPADFDVTGEDELVDSELRHRRIN